MRRSRLAIALGIAGLLLPLAACGGDGAGTAAPTGPGTASSPAGATSPAATGSPSESSPVPPPVWPTDDVNVPFRGAVPPTPTLTAIRSGTHPEGGFDRISFVFDGQPGYRAGYESKIIYDGSGEPAHLDGEAYLHLVFNV